MKRILALFVGVLLGVSLLHAGKGESKAVRGNIAFVVYPSNLVYEEGTVIPGMETAGDPRHLLQEGGFAVLQPGVSPLLRLGIQDYRAPESGPTRYAYIDRLDALDTMVATNGSEVYHLGMHTFNWIVAPVQDADELRNFMLNEGRVILYNPEEGETVESAVRRFIRRSSTLSPASSYDSWVDFIANLPERIVGEPFNVAINNDVFQAAEHFEIALQAVHEPIREALIQRRTGAALQFPSEAMTLDVFHQHLELIDGFQHHLNTFDSFNAMGWMQIWNAYTAFLRSRLELYQLYVGGYMPERARSLFTFFIRRSSLLLIESLGQLQEREGLPELQNLVFQRTNNPIGWRELMDRPFNLDDIYPVYEQRVESFVNETQIHQPQYESDDDDSASLSVNALRGHIRGICE